MTKNDIKLYLTVCFALVAALIVAIVWQRREVTVDSVNTTDTIYSTKLEIRRDTIKEFYPMPFLCVLRGDSIPVAPGVKVPVEVKEYQDSNYYARISGVQPSLDEIRVYPRTIIEYRDAIITNTRTKLVKDNRRWGIGIQAGWGWSRDGPSPYLGLGVSYNIFRF